MVNKKESTRLTSVSNVASGIQGFLQFLYFDQQI